MTDGAALPIYLSKNVDTLKKKGLIDNTITIGSAFGGDYECINIYTALITAKEVLKADVVFVSMGPGIAGTGTKYGFTGIEQCGSKAWWYAYIYTKNKFCRSKGET